MVRLLPKNIICHLPVIKGWWHFLFVMITLKLAQVASSQSPVARVK